MKLFYTPIHAFIHKILVTAHEVGVWDQIEVVPVYPVRHGYSLGAINPLHKVPCIALEDGTMLYGSQTAVEYLDSISTTGHHLYPPEGPKRWNALRRLALGDTMFESTVIMALESSEKPPRNSVYSWYWPKIVRGLAQMEEDATKGFDSFDIGQASTLHALTYLDRQTQRGLHPPVPTGYDWRDSHPNLKAWFNEAVQRPSVIAHFNKDFDGDDSPEYCQSKVAEVLRAQQKDPGPGPYNPVPVDFVPPEN